MTRCSSLTSDELAQCVGQPRWKRQRQRQAGGHAAGLRGRPSSCSPVVRQHIHGLRTVEVLQPSIARLDQSGTRREVIDDQLRRRTGDSDLLSLGDRAQTSSAVHGPTEVIAVALDRLTRVDCDAHLNRAIRWPIGRRQSALHGDGGRRGVTRQMEDTERRVTLAPALQHHTVVRVDCGGDDLLVVLESRRHRIGRPLPQPCRAHHIGQHERHHSRGQRRRTFRSPTKARHPIVLCDFPPLDLGSQRRRGGMSTRQ